MAEDTIPQHRNERQASVTAVFGHSTAAAAAAYFRTAWEKDRPNEPLHAGAVLHGILADMNAALPEPFTVETPDARYVTGPDLPLLPLGWTVTAGTTFRTMDLSLNTYTVASVLAWRKAGNGGYPWPWPPTNTTGTFETAHRFPEAARGNLR